MHVSQPWLSHSRRRSCPRELMETGERPEEPGVKVSFQKRLWWKSWLRINKLGIKRSLKSRKALKSTSNLKSLAQAPAIFAWTTPISLPHIPWNLQRQLPQTLHSLLHPATRTMCLSSCLFFSRQVDFSLSSSTSLETHGLQATIPGVAKSQTHYWSDLAHVHTQWEQKPDWIWLGKNDKRKYWEIFKGSC